MSQFPYRPNNLNPVLLYLRNLAEGRFWGNINLRFEDGRVIHIRREESILPNKLAEQPEKVNE